jgi:hypothetical protein
MKDIIMKNDNKDLDDPIIIQMEKYGVPQDSNTIQTWRDDDELWTKSEKET